MKLIKFINFVLYLIILTDFNTYFQLMSCFFFLRYNNDEIHFNLMAIVSDRKMLYERKMKDLEVINFKTRFRFTSAAVS